MKSLRRLLLALVVLALVAVVADRATDLFLERGIEDSLSTVPGVVTQDDTTQGSGTADGGPSVEVEDIPVLTSLVSGELDSLRVGLPAYDVDTGQGTLRIDDIEAHLRGVATSVPHLIRDLTATATISADSLAPAASAAGIPGTLTTGEEGVTLSVEVLGQPAAVTLGISPDEGGRTLVLTPRSATLGGLEVSIDIVAPVLGELPTIPLDGLPEGVRVVRIDSDPGGLSARLTGQDVAFR